MWRVLDHWPAHVGRRHNPGDEELGATTCGDDPPCRHRRQAGRKAGRRLAQATSHNTRLTTLHTGQKKTRADAQIPASVQQVS